MISSPVQAFNHVWIKPNDKNSSENLFTDNDIITRALEVQTPYVAPILNHFHYSSLIGTLEFSSNMLSVEVDTMFGSTQIQKKW